MSDRMGIHLLFLNPQKGRGDKGKEGRRGEEMFRQKRANCTINQEAPSCLHWISPITDSFSGLRKLEALNRATITLLIMRQRGLDFK